MKFKLLYLFFVLFSSFSSFAQPRYNEVFRIATHNSYWVKRAANFDFFASGTQERLCDQLLFDGVRALEIDIHTIKNKPGQWAVYHTTKKKNVFFENFTDFLKQLQQFHYSLPQHEVVTIVLELKEITRQNFDKTHTPAQLDSLLETYLGDLLYRPGDLRKRCPDSGNLLGCVKSSPEIWPTIEDLRGKFIFTVLGNFHWGSIGHGGEGWATYAVSENPSAFPMSSDFSVFNTKKNSEKIPTEILEKAYNASIFQQVENIGDTNHLKEIAKFIREGGIVRGANSFSIAEQQARIKAGFHMLQTDYPWLAYRDKGFEQPFRAIDSVRYNDASFFQEPGERILLFPGQEHFMIDSNIYSLSRWETLPTSTRSSTDPDYPNQVKPYGKGCIFAESDSLNSISICRKVNKKQNAVITTEVIENGKKSMEKFVSNKRTSGKVGDYISMLIENICIDSVSKVYVYSSSEMENNKGKYDLPKWNMLFSKSFSTPLKKQGIKAMDADVLFTGTKLELLDLTPSSK